MKYIEKVSEDGEIEIWKMGCSKCGAELEGTELVCPKCRVLLQQKSYIVPKGKAKKD